MANVMGACEYVTEESPRKLTMMSEDPSSIMKVHDQLRDRHVRSAARKLLMLGSSGGRTMVMLNRQAAFADVLALCGSEEESPLGPLMLTVESKDLDQVIRWLTAYEEG